MSYLKLSACTKAQMYIGTLPQHRFCKSQTPSLLVIYLYKKALFQLNKIRMKAAATKQWDKHLQLLLQFAVCISGQLCINIFEREADVQSIVCWLLSLAAIMKSAHELTVFQCQKSRTNLFLHCCTLTRGFHAQLVSNTTNRELP